MDQNKQIELQEMAALQFTVEECAKILGVSTRDITIPENYQFYEKGQLKTIADVRQVILTQAKQGSSPAQNHFIKLIEDTISKNKENELFNG
jgi:hypothetical protein